MAERASRTDDYLGSDAGDLVRRGARVSFHGRHTDFAGIDAHPGPSARIPIVVGGRTAGACRRSIEQGDGWYGFFLDPSRRPTRSPGCAAAASRYDRPAELGELEISVTPKGPVTADTLRAYADAGVHRLIVYPLPVDDEADVDRFVAEQADLVLG